MLDSGVLWKEDITAEDVANPEWHRQQEDKDYPRDYIFEQAVMQMLSLYRQSKIGFDLNRVDLTWLEWEVIMTISEWFEMKKQEREDAILGVKKN